MPHEALIKFLKPHRIKTFSLISRKQSFFTYMCTFKNSFLFSFLISLHTTKEHPLPLKKIRCCNKGLINVGLGIMLFHEAKV